MLLLVGGALLGWFLRFPTFLTGIDDTTYLLLSHSLEAGSYRDIWLVGTPLHGQYPPGMPAWLWLIGQVGGGLAMVTILQLGLLAATGWLLADALRRLGHGTVGIITAGLVMVNPMLTYHAGSMLSEILFLAVTTVTMYALLRAELLEEGEGWQWLALAVGSALAAFLVRTIGLAAIAALIATLLMRRRWRWAAVASFLSLVTVGGWMTYVLIATRDSLGHSYLTDLNGTTPAQTGGGTVSAITALVTRAGTNLREYLEVGVPGLLSLPMVPGSIADNLIWSLLLGLAGGIGFLYLARRWPVVPLYATAAVVILLLWPWPIERLALPLVPIGLAAILLGAEQSGRRLARRGGGNWILLATTTALGFAGLQGQAKRWIEMQGCPSVDPYATPAFCTTPEQRALIAAIRAVDRDLPPTATIATSKRPLTYYLSGRQTVPLDLLDHQFETLAGLLPRLGVSHILLSRMNPVEIERVGPRLLAVCDELAIATPVEGPAVVLRERSVGEPDACPTLRRLMAWQVTAW